VVATLIMSRRFIFDVETRERRLQQQALEREASAILRADKRKQERKIEIAVSRPKPEPPTTNKRARGYVSLAELSQMKH
jgi:hypothetical protein